MKTTRVVLAVALLGVLLSAAAQNDPERQSNDDRVYRADARSQRSREYLPQGCCDYPREYVSRRDVHCRDDFRAHRHYDRRGCGVRYRNPEVCCDAPAEYRREDAGRTYHRPGHGCGWTASDTSAYRSYRRYR
ncbi:MAG TPA: hypothetical protein IAD30_00880 [Bacteroidetes bacterium]|nr:hypothetical protein [Bacteroidota bacterium]